MYVLQENLTDEEKVNYLISMMHLNNTSILPNITLGEFFYAFNKPQINIINTFNRTHMLNLAYFSTSSQTQKDNINENDIGNFDLISKASTMFYELQSEEKLEQEKNEIKEILDVSKFMTTLTEDTAFPLFVIYIKQKTKVNYVKNKSFIDYIEGIKNYFSKVEKYMNILIEAINVEQKKQLANKPKQTTKKQNNGFKI